MDDLACLRAAVRFHALVGRSPTRRDFRSPDREQWENRLALELPTEAHVSHKFRNWTSYLTAAGLTPSRAGNNAAIEAAAIAHVRDVYPDMELVAAEANSFDAYANGGEKVEIKGSALSIGTRSSGNTHIYFNWQTHKRDYVSTVDRLVLVGLGYVEESYVPLVRLEFSGAGLVLPSRKGTVMLRTSTIWEGGFTQYAPHIVWRADLQPSDYARYLSRGLPT